MGVGEYPPEYNPKVHGPYNPATYYGKPDATLGEVKVGEVGSWLARRNWTPNGIAAAVSRGYWRWNQRWIQPRRGGVAGIAQVAVAMSVFYYFLHYRAHTNHRHYKYH